MADEQVVAPWHSVGWPTGRPTSSAWSWTPSTCDAVSAAPSWSALPAVLPSSRPAEPTGRRDGCTGDLPAPDPMPHRRDNVAAARVESEDVLDRPVALQVLALDRAGARYKGNAPINFGCRTASLLV